MGHQADYRNRVILSRCEKNVLQKRTRELSPPPGLNHTSLARSFVDAFKSAGLGVGADEDVVPAIGYRM